LTNNKQQENHDNFVNLHGHSVFSLLDGMVSPKELVDYTLELGQPASCITDHGYMYSTVDHFKYAEKKGQKPIAGFEAYVVDDHTVRDKKEAQSGNDVRREHFVILAKNNSGYTKMTKLCSIGASEGFYYKPRIDDELIEEIGTEDLIGMSACLGGRIAQELMSDNYEEAKKQALYYYELFNEDFYLELQPTDEDDQIKVNKGLIKLHKDTGIPVVATTDFHYLKEEDYNTHELLLAVQTSTTIDDPNRWTFPGNTFYVMSREQIEQAFKTNGHEVLDQDVIKQALDNTVEIANQCNVSFEWGNHQLPQIEAPESNKEFYNWAENKPDGISSENYLRYLCIKGLKEKNKTSKEYRDRLDYELNIINEMGFPDYFLIFYDIMKYCDEEGIPYGPGRGSAGGSLVSYALDIIKIDPIKYNLIFERFLNPERKKMPDIDADFCIDQGWKVFKYLEETYGKDKCCNIITFGRLRLKAVLKDVGRALGIPFNELNSYTKQIPKEYSNVDDLKDDPDLNGFFDKYPEIYEHAKKLQDIPRHHSQHPAGICVSPVKVTEVLPVQKGKEYKEGVEPGYLSQFEKKQTEQSGLKSLVHYKKYGNCWEARETLLATA
jgi:DNA polymerase-3 subunit alpha